MLQSQTQTTIIKFSSESNGTHHQCSKIFSTRWHVISSPKHVAQFVDASACGFWPIQRIPACYTQLISRPVQRNKLLIIFGFEPINMGICFAMTFIFVCTIQYTCVFLVWYREFSSFWASSFTRSFSQSNSPNNALDLVPIKKDLEDQKDRLLFFVNTNQLVIMLLRSSKSC